MEYKDIIGNVGWRVQSSIDEMRIAEDNFDVIHQIATEVATKTLLAHYSGGMQMIAPLELLLSDLKTIFTFIRREMRAKDQSLDFGKSQVAPNDAQFPNEILDRHQCICPLTVFLRSVAQSLTILRIKVGENAWASISPLRNLLVSLEGKLRESPAAKGSRLWPGMAKCIMFHEEQSQFTVTSSAVRYLFLSGMKCFGDVVRQRYIESMKATCTLEVISRITVIDQHSDDLDKHFRTRRDSRDEIWHKWQNPFENPSSRAKIGGYGATFSGRGTYMVTCLLDYWRFEMERPPEAKAKEEMVSMFARQSLGKDSCAEWELWITYVSRPRPQQPTSIYIGGLVGAKTGPPQPLPPDETGSSRRYSFF